MGKSLQILIGSESNELINQIIEILKHGGFSISQTSAANLNKLSLALKEKQWDFIIADDDSPDLNGSNILKYLESHQVDSPIILISSNADDDTMVDFIKKGMCDVISKSNLKSLNTAVWREYNHKNTINERILFEREMRQSEQFLRDIFNTVQEGICVVDTSLNILRVNSWIKKTFDDKTIFSGQKCFFVFKNRQTQCESCPCVSTLKDGRTYQEIFKYSKSNGEIYWYDLTSYPLKNTHGKIIGVIQSVKDITKQKNAEDDIRELNEQLEKRVKLRTSQLEATNKELESFSYSVSHDLRAPLVRIDGFSQLLTDGYNDILDDEGKHFLNRIRSSVLNMSELIDNLLLLSRVTRSEMKITEINLSKIVQNIVEPMREASPKRNVELVIEKDVLARGDVRLLKLVLENLLNNAWKFTQHTENAKIEFGNLNNNKETIFFIKDNGAGFNNDYAERLFAPFQRLHSEKEFLGNGVGLATVKRIIMRHGGNVWAEGEINKGATFYFSLPEE